MNTPTVRRGDITPPNIKFVFTECLSVTVPILVTYNQYTIKGEAAFCKPNPSKIALWLY